MSDVPIKLVERILIEAGIDGISFKQAGKILKRVADLIAENEDLRDSVVVKDAMLKRLLHATVDMMRSEHWGGWNWTVLAGDGMLALKGKQSK